LIEHFPSPYILLNKIKDIIKKDSVVFIYFPSLDAMKLDPPFKWGYGIHITPTLKGEHQNIFSLSGFTKVVNKAGYKILLKGIVDHDMYFIFKLKD
jgi:hypothetical protein